MVPWSFSRYSKEARVETDILGCQSQSLKSRVVTDLSLFKERNVVIELSLALQPWSRIRPSGARTDHVNSRDVCRGLRNHVSTSFFVLTSIFVQYGSSQIR